MHVQYCEHLEWDVRWMNSLAWCLLSMGPVFDSRRKLIEYSDSDYTLKLYAMSLRYQHPMEDNEKTPSVHLIDEPSRHETVSSHIISSESRDKSMLYISATLFKI